ncbi:MAG: DUF4388 domain-containing protein [Pseudomonadota bacterium]
MNTTRSSCKKQLESRFAESYRTLRTSLHLSSVMEKNLNSILITSSLASEGKTTTAMNLASTLVQTGKKVLLVDADLRRPGLTEKLFPHGCRHGLTGLITALVGDRPNQGNLSIFSVSDLVHLIRLQNRTGTLTVTDGIHQVSFDFIRGIPANASWITRPESRKLANMLIQKRLLNKEDAKRAIVQQQRSKMKLGTILLSLGLVSKNELSQNLMTHLVESIMTASTMQHGSFVFNDTPWGETIPAITPGLDLGSLVHQLLARHREPVFIKKSMAEVIFRTGKDNLFILPSGEVPDNPAELLGSGCIPFLIEQLKKQFDCIIIDSPPVMATSDALSIAPWVDGTILVVRAGQTEKKLLKTVVNRFEGANLPLLGVLLNRVDLNREGYYRFHKKYYTRA